MQAGGTRPRLDQEGGLAVSISDHTVSRPPCGSFHFPTIEALASHRVKVGERVRRGAKDVGVDVGLQVAFGLVGVAARVGHAVLEVSKSDQMYRWWCPGAWCKGRHV